MFENEMLRIANEISRDTITLDTDLEESKMLSSFQMMVFVSRVEKLTNKKLFFSDVKKLRTIRKMGEYFDE